MFKQYRMALLAWLTMVVGLLPVLATQPAGHTKHSLDEVQANLKAKKAILLDVREQDEWDQGHVRHAQHLPLSKLKKGVPAAELARQVPKDKTIYTHCVSGRRSLEAAKLLHQAGYNVEPLKEGYKELVEAGFDKAPR